MVNFVRKHDKLTCWILGIILVLSLIPVFIISGYDAAAGDDYNFGASSHLIFLQTGSVLAAIKAAWQTSVSTWYSWQGTWFDCFVFCLHPEVFSDSAYVIVPYIFLTLHIIGFLTFAHHFLKVRWQIEGLYWLQVGLLFLIFEFQLMPSPKNGIFWWVGCVHYIMPLFMALIGIVLGDRFLLTHRIRDLAGLFLVSALMGGATYPAALLLPIAIFLIWLAEFVLGGKRDKKDFLLLIPFAALMVGLVISAIAPGNANRAASDLKNGATPAGGPVATIIESFRLSVVEGAGSFVLERGFILIALMAVLVLTLSAFRTVGKENAEKTSSFAKVFSHPLLFMLVMFCVNASVYAPRAYSGGVVSFGYYDFNFLTFFTCLVAAEIYVLGWLFFCKGLLVKGAETRGAKILLNCGFVVLALVIAFLSRHGVKQYTDYVCMEYYLSGQADDYKEQIALQRRLLEGDEPEVCLPGINNEQGPLMHMPVVEDPDNIDNYMTAKFYGKAKIWAIPRSEWMELYGE